MLNSREEIEPYVPHSNSMLLLDRVIEHNADTILVELDVVPNLPCYTHGSLPAYVSIEVMAQSIAAWFGIRRATPDVKPPIGYLIGVRQFECTKEDFSEKSTLTILSKKLFESDRLANFQCTVDCRNGDDVQLQVAIASISVYSTA